MSKPNKFARELLDEQIARPIGDHSSNLAEACKRLLAVLDGLKFWRGECPCCGEIDAHMDDCPVAACIEAGLQKT